MLELSGEVGDGLLGWFCSSPLDRSCGRTRRGCRPDWSFLAGFDLTWMLPALVSDDPDARNLMRPYVATYLTAGWPSYDRVADVSGFGQVAAELRGRLQHARHFDEVASAVSDEMLDAFALCGPAGEVRARIEGLRETGVTTLCLFPISPGQFYPHVPRREHAGAACLQQERRPSATPVG